MPIVPALPIVPVPATGHHAHAHPPPAGGFAALAQSFAASVQAQTANAVKAPGANAKIRDTRRSTETDDSLDEETNTLDAKAKRRPGTHILDVEA